MKKFFSQFFNIRKGELIVTFMMLAYIYLIMVAYYFLKPARDSLFISKIGWQQLPFVFILIAMIAIPVNAVYARAGSKLKLNQLMNYTTLILIVCLVVMRWVILTGTTWAMYVFYIWVSIYGVLATSQFWLFANVIYSPTQAKRLFVLLNLGAIIGAFTGGNVTNLIVSTFNVRTENLLFFCIAFLTVCIFLNNAIWAIKKKEVEETPTKTVKKEPQQKENILQIFRSIKRSHYLLLIAGVIAMTMATGTFVDTQFKGVTQEHFADLEGDPDNWTDAEKNAMTGFFGTFYGWLSLVSFILQLFFTYRFIRILGVGGIITFLPIGLLLGSSVMLFFPGLFAGVLLRGSDGSFKYSIDKTGRELLFLPVPLNIKKRVKVFIDVVVDRWFRGLAGILLLLCIYVADFSLQQLSIPVIILLGVWLFFIFLIRKEYVNAFRQAIEKRSIDLDELTVNIDDPAAIQHVTAALKSENERQVSYALDILVSAQNIDLSEEVKPLLEHASNEIRLKSIRVLSAQTGGAFVEEVKNRITDSDPEIQVEALHYLRRHAGADRFQLIENNLEHEDLRIKAAAAVCVAEFGTEEEKPLLDEKIVKTLFESEAPVRKTCRFQLAKALGALNRTEFRSYIRELMSDESPEVKRQAIAAAGRTKDRDFLLPLFKDLENRKYRRDARSALVSYGNKILGTLNDHLNDRSVDFRLRMAIPSILSGIPTQESVNVLTESIKTIGSPFTFYLIKALSKIRAKYPELIFNEGIIDSLLIEQTKKYYVVLNALEQQKKIKKTPGGELLEKAMTEKLDRNLEKIFRLLGLRYPARDIYSAYNGIRSGQKNIQASAVEFLDNVLSKNLKKHLMPIIDADTTENPVGHGQKLFNLEIHSFDSALETLITGNDSWLKACAIFNVSKTYSTSLKDLVVQARDDLDPVVKETAELVMKREWY